MLFQNVLLRRIQLPDNKQEKRRKTFYARRRNIV